MTSSRWIGLLFLVGLFFPGHVRSEDSPARRNVILIVADDLGFQIGAYGDKVAKTPGLDRLAATGTRFTRAHCTTASCSASIASSAPPSIFTTPSTTQPGPPSSTAPHQRQRLAGVCSGMKRR